MRVSDNNSNDEKQDAFQHTKQKASAGLSPSGQNALLYAEQFGARLLPLGIYDKEKSEADNKCAKQPLNVCTKCACRLPPMKQMAKVSCRKCGAKYARGETGVHLATSDPQVLTSIWSTFPKAGIGWAMGPQDDGRVLVAIDVDVDKSTGKPSEEWLALLAKHGELPMTLRAVTGSGGQHYVFEVDAADALPKNSVRKLADGVDTRGEGGYIAVFPTVHPNGNQYKWHKEALPSKTPIAKLPEWLAERLRPAPVAAPEPVTERTRSLVAELGDNPQLAKKLDAYVTSALDGEVGNLAGQQVGGRNDALNKAAFRLGHFVGGGLLSRADVEARLESAAAENGSWSDDGPAVCKTTIASGLTAGMAKPISQEEIVQKLTAEDEAKRASRQRPAAASVKPVPRVARAVGEAGGAAVGQHGQQDVIDPETGEVLEEAAVERVAAAVIPFARPGEAGGADASAVDAWDPWADEWPWDVLNDRMSADARERLIDRLAELPSHRLAHWMEHSKKVLAMTKAELTNAVRARAAAFRKAAREAAIADSEQARDAAREARMAAGVNSIVAAAPEDIAGVHEWTTGCDTQIAGCLMADLNRFYGQQIVTADGEAYGWTGERWEPVRPEILRTSIMRYRGQERGDGELAMNRARIDGSMKNVWDETGRPGFFTNAAVGLNTKTGFWTLGPDGKLRREDPHPEQAQRHVIDADFDGSPLVFAPDGSLLNKFLMGCFGNDDDCAEKIDLLQEIAGCLLFDMTSTLTSPAAIVLYGPSAGNGKSEIIKLLTAMLPSDAHSVVKPSQFGEAFAAAGLAGSRFNFAGELERHIMSDAFKTVVSGDEISAREPYKPHFIVKPRALHMFAANELPSFTNGMDQGVRRRLLVLTFNRSIPIAERIANIGELIASTERNILVAWAVAGAIRLATQGGFTRPASNAEAMDEWVEIADSVSAWCQHHLTVTGEQHDRVTVSDAFDSYEKWCDRERLGSASRCPKNRFSSRVVAALQGAERQKSGSTRFVRCVRMTTKVD